MKAANDNLTAEEEFRRTENRKRLDGMLIIAIVAAFWFVQLQPLFAADKVPGPYNAQVLSCNDGDTCTMQIDMWPGIELTSKVRLRGIDAPETYRPKSDCEAILAENSLAALNLLLGLSAGLAQSEKGVTLTRVGYDDFGRVLADVHADGVNVGAAMIDGGHARVYVKGDTVAWC